MLDAQWVRTQQHPRAVPQRRRRVFVVGCLGDPTAAAQVLFERESVQRDSASRRASREGAAADAEGCSGTVSSKWAKGTGGPAGDECYNLTTQTVSSTLGNRGLRSHTEIDGHGAYIPVAFQQNTRDEVRMMNGDGQIAGALAAESGMKQQNYIAQPVAFRKSRRAQSVNDHETWVAAEQANTLNQFDTGERDTHAVAHGFYSTGGTHGLNHHPEVSPAVKVGSGLGIPSPPAVAFNETAATLKGGSGARGYPDPSDGNGHSMVGTAMTVRRLTPRECERLQGFPDDWTMIPWRKKAADECPDGPRYKALGNSMAVNVMAWIGERIDNYERTGNAVRTEG